jgi:hypothetical protein
MDDKGNIIPCEQKRLQELGSDAYTAMAPFYETLYGAANKYKNERTGKVSDFNSARATVKALLKHPSVLFMKKHHIPDEISNMEHNPYGVQSYTTPITEWSPSDWAEPRKEHPGLRDWFNNMKAQQEDRRMRRRAKKDAGKTGCWGANCVDNETQDQAKYGGSTWLDEYGPGGATTDGCPAYYHKNAQGQCVPIFDFKMPTNYSTDRQQVVVPMQERAKAEEQVAQQKVEARRQFIGPDHFQTDDEKKINLQKKKNYVVTHPNTKLDDNNNIVTINPDRDMEGRALPNTRAARIDKGMSHIMNAIEATTALTGAGQIGSNLVRLGASGLEKAIGRNLLSRNLKNFTGRINPTLNAIDEAGAYVQMDPVGIMGNKINSKYYNPTTSLNTANNTITGVEKNLTNSAIEGADIVAGQNNLANIIDANKNAGKFISSQPEILGVQHGMDALPPGYNAHLRGKGRYVPPATGDMAPYISYEPPEYSDAETIWRSWFKNEPPPYNPRPGFGPQDLTSNSSKGLFGKISDKYIYPIKYKKQIAELESQLGRSIENLNTPEGRKRLADLGINPEEVFTNVPSITSDPTKGSSYSPNTNTINVNMRDAKRLKATPQQIIEHEQGHNIQVASRASGQNAMTEIDHNAQLIDLKEPQTISDLEAMTHLQQEQYAGAKLEGMPYLREMRQDMLERGFIKNQYDEVDPSIMEKYLNSNSGQRFKKLIDTSNTNYRIIPLLLNRLPVAAGAIAGSAAIANEKKHGGSIKFKYGGEGPYPKFPSTGMLTSIGAGPKVPTMKKGGKTSWIDKYNF